ncbi:DUF1846 domain-containing protein [Mycoplasma phocoeninasale]|uniref:DUF1846 domain-containing protein n=1 Tax=Mycoplasma phocoeninasale TaxID=2726117 RepID=A0A858U4H6_9MOLU|nr:DUF1846 domain-containing protein [Mycoplasma phocoeninasale]QJG66143.1 DUF1846 domain-containing protein [Mycoplasma phocoeninasale]
MTAFDNQKYIDLQSKKIEERIAKFGHKLYLEFGGKLINDFHASRVLPGFNNNVKLEMLLKLKHKMEIIVVVSANDIEKHKLRADIGISYDQDVLRLIDQLRSYDLIVNNVVITQYENQSLARKFKHKLISLGINVACHYMIKNYPNDIDLIISDNGFGKNEYVKTEKELVVITAPGPGSGKLAVALSQIYHDSKNGVKSGYAKFETFPIWNLAVSHPINLAYEAATADLNDMNMIDPFYLNKYSQEATNYNRDIAAFPILNNLLTKIYDGKSPYFSPTDMGVNMAGFCISDERAVADAAKKEIIRRYFKSLVDFKKDLGNFEAVEKIEKIMSTYKIDYSVNSSIKSAHKLFEKTKKPAVCVLLKDQTIINGKTSDLLGPSAAALLNSLKYLAKIDQNIDLLDPSVIKLVQDLKINYLHNKNPRLHMNETLIALSISAKSNDISKRAMLALPQLKDCDAHSTVILSEVDRDIYKKLSINLTEDPIYEINNFFHK